MTPEQRIKRELLLLARERGQLEFPFRSLDTATGDDIDALWKQYRYEDDDYDNLFIEIENEFREGVFETGLNAPYSRHYESKAVACKLRDGTWIGWTFLYGGGKHGEPEKVEWMEGAYELTVTEAMEWVVVRRFVRKEASEDSAPSQH